MGACCEEKAVCMVFLSLRYTPNSCYSTSSGLGVQKTYHTNLNQQLIASLRMLNFFSNSMVGWKACDLVYDADCFLSKVTRTWYMLVLR